MYLRGFGAIVGLGGTAGGTVDRFGEEFELYKGFRRPRTALTSASLSCCWCWGESPGLQMRGPTIFGDPTHFASLLRSSVLLQLPASKFCAKIESSRISIEALRAFVLRPMSSSLDDNMSTEALRLRPLPSEMASTTS